MARRQPKLNENANSFSRQRNRRYFQLELVAEINMLGMFYDGSQSYIRFFSFKKKIENCCLFIFFSYFALLFPDRCLNISEFAWICRIYALFMLHSYFTHIWKYTYQSGILTRNYSCLISVIQARVSNIVTFQNIK